MKRAVNMMRYPFVLHDENGEVFSLPPSGQLIGVNEDVENSVVEFENIGRVPVSTVRSTVSALPSMIDDVVYIVPMRVLLAMHEQGYDTSDFYAPNMLVKDNTGRVIGSRRLMQLPQD